MDAEKCPLKLSSIKSFRIILFNPFKVKHSIAVHTEITLSGDLAAVFRYIEYLIYHPAFFTDNLVFKRRTDVFHFI